MANAKTHTTTSTAIPNISNATMSVSNNIGYYNTTAANPAHPPLIPQSQRDVAYDLLGQLAVLGHDEAVELLKLLLRTIDKAEGDIRVLREALARATQTVTISPSQRPSPPFHPWRVDPYNGMPPSGWSSGTLTFTGTGTDGDGES